MKPSTMDIAAVKAQLQFHLQQAQACQLYLKEATVKPTPAKVLKPLINVFNVPEGFWRNEIEAVFRSLPKDENTISAAQITGIVDDKYRLSKGEVRHRAQINLYRQLRDLVKSGFLITETPDPRKAPVYRFASGVTSVLPNVSEQGRKSLQLLQSRAPSKKAK